MTNRPESSRLVALPDILLLSLLSASAYVAARGFEIGYLEGFGIQGTFARIRTETIVEAGTALLGVLIVLNGLFSLISARWLRLLGWKSMQSAFAFLILGIATKSAGSLNMLVLMLTGPALYLYFIWIAPLRGQVGSVYARWARDMALDEATITNWTKGSLVELATPEGTRSRAWHRSVLGAFLLLLTCGYIARFEGRRQAKLVCVMPVSIGSPRFAIVRAYPEGAVAIELSQSLRTTGRYRGGMETRALSLVDENVCGTELTRGWEASEN